MKVIKLDESDQIRWKWLRLDKVDWIRWKVIEIVTQLPISGRGGREELGHFGAEAEEVAGVEETYGPVQLHVDGRADAAGAVEEEAEGVADVVVGVGLDGGGGAGCWLALVQGLGVFAEVGDVFAELVEQVEFELVFSVDFLAGWAVRVYY
jgi:hypothetical protein